MIPETTTSPLTEVESPQVDPAEQERVRDLFFSMDKSLRLMRLYDRSNTIYLATVDGLMQKFTTVLEDTGELVATVTDEGFLAAGELHQKSARREASVAFRLYRDGVRSLRFTQGLDRDELVRLLSDFETQPDTLGRLEEDMATILWRENFKHIEVVSVDEIGVGRGKAAGKEDAPDTSSDLNSKLESMLDSIKTSLVSPLSGDAEAEAARPAPAGELDLLEMNRLAKRPSRKEEEENDEDRIAVREGTVEKLRAELDSDLNGGLVLRVADIITDVLLVGPCTISAEDALDVLWQFLRDLLERGHVPKVNEILDRIGYPPEGAPDILRDLHKGILKRLGAEDSAGVILAAACANPQGAGEPHLGLISRLPSSSLRHLARHMGKLEAGPVKDAWKEIFLDRSGEDPLILFAYLEHEGGEQAVAAVRKALAQKIPGAPDLLRDLLAHPEERVRADVLKVCTALPVGVQRTILETGLADSSARVRFAALRAIEAGKDRTLIPVLAKRIEQSTDADEDPVRLVHAIAVLGGEEAAACLRKFLLPRQRWLPFGLGSGRARPWRRAAAAALHDVSDEGIRDLLEEGASSFDRRFAETCLTSLARDGDQEVETVSAPATTASPQLGQKAGEDFVKMSREFLLALSQLMSVSRFHQLDNEAVRTPSAAVADWTTKLCAGGKKLEVLFEKGQAYVNQQRIRLSGGLFETIQTLAASLASRKLGGLEIGTALTPDSLRAFLSCYNDVPRETEDPASRIEKALVAAGVNDLKVLRPRGGSSSGRGFGATVDVEMATLLYAKAVVLLREMIRRWEDDTARGYLGARVTRVVQGIISLAERNSRPFHWLIHVKDDREYLFTHGANVALLSILMGLRIGIDRNRLCELGAGALFHDLGHLLLPAEMDQSKGLTTEDRKALALHPVHGVNLLLRLRRVDESVLTRIAVIFEHNLVSNGYPRPDWPAPSHLFSRIVAIADAYDAMTTRRHYRPARTPQEALRELHQGAGSRYDPDLVRVFTSILGIYPLGTIVRLDTGEVAVVYHSDPSAPRRPLVKILIAADGTRLGEGQLMDLAESDESGNPRRSIVDTVEAASVGINVAGFLWESQIS